MSSNLGLAAVEGLNFFDVIKVDKIEGTFWWKIIEKKFGKTDESISLIFVRMR